MIGAVGSGKTTGCLYPYADQTRMSPEWKDAHPAVPWRQSVGLRNLLAHGYWVIDAEELWDVARK